MTPDRSLFERSIDSRSSPQGTTSPREDKRRTSKPDRQALETILPRRPDALSGDLGRASRNRTRITSRCLSNLSPSVLASPESLAAPPTSVPREGSIVVSLLLPRSWRDPP